MSISNEVPAVRLPSEQRRGAPELVSRGGHGGEDFGNVTRRLLGSCAALEDRVDSWATAPPSTGAAGLQRRRIGVQATNQHRSKWAAHGDQEERCRVGAPGSLGAQDVAREAEGGAAGTMMLGPTSLLFIFDEKLPS